MARYEKMGYCPEVAILRCLHSWNDPELIAEWNELNFGDYIPHMVYSENGTFYRELPYMVTLLLDSTMKLRIQLETLLRVLMPRKEQGFPIVCTDVINPYQIPVNLSCYYDADTSSESWLLGEDEDWSKTFLLQDDIYLVVIFNSEKELRVWIYKR